MTNAIESNSSNLPFSLVRQAGDMIYLSGELGFDSKGQLTGDIAQQTEQSLENIERTLLTRGLDRSHIVSCTCFLVSKSDFAGFNAAYRQFFSRHPLPVRATVVADLVVEGALIEICVVACESHPVS